MGGRCPELVGRRAERLQTSPFGHSSGDGSNYVLNIFLQNTANTMSFSDVFVNIKHLNLLL